MLRKYSMSLLAIAILLTGSLIIFAQTAPVRGKVELKKADGTLTPVVGASVEVYRTDIKAKLPSSKTDKKGNFVFAGLPLGATMTLVISGPGIKADMYPGIKAGREDLNLTVSEGDGQNLTETEVRSALSTAPKQGGQPAEESSEAKKAREEFEKQRAEIEAKNKKAETANSINKRVAEEGAKAITDGNNNIAALKYAEGIDNYTLAISKYDEGINADPEFAGSATVFLNNKSIALTKRGFAAYKLGVGDPANKASWQEKAKSDFQNVIISSQRTLDLIKTITDAVELKKYDGIKLIALSNRLEAHRLLIGACADTSQTAEAIAAMDEYLAVETDPAAKTKNQGLLADVLRLSGNSALAVPIYRKVLEIAPDNVDAVGSLGLSLFDVGVSNTNKEQMQEGLNIMQHFTDIAPDTHPLKASVKDAVTYLKDQEKLIPQKTPKTTTTTKKKP